MSHRNVVDPILTYLGLVFVNSECYQCMDKCQFGGDANDINACPTWQWDRLCNICPLVLFDTKHCICFIFHLLLCINCLPDKAALFCLPGKLCTCNLGLEAGNRVKIFIRQPSGSEQNWNNNKKNRNEVQWKSKEYSSEMLMTQTLLKQTHDPDICSCFTIKNPPVCFLMVYKR